jgi:hypothetical protein
MYALSDYKLIYNNIKEGNQNVQYDIFTEFMASKFAETSAIFKKFDTQAINEFVNKTRYQIFEDMNSVFEKGTPCNQYLFILNGKQI